MKCLPDVELVSDADVRLVLDQNYRLCGLDLDRAAVVRPGRVSEASAA
jgi:hypothetical protein